MTFEESWNAIEAELANLRVHDVAPEGVERIREHCVATLAKPRSRRAGLSISFAPWIEPAFAFGLSAVFLAAAIGGALPLLR